MNKLLFGLSILAFSSLSFASMYPIQTFDCVNSNNTAKVTVTLTTSGVGSIEVESDDKVLSTNRYSVRIAYQGWYSGPETTFCSRILSSGYRYNFVFPSNVHNKNTSDIEATLILNRTRPTKTYQELDLICSSSVE